MGPEQHDYRLKNKCHASAFMCQRKKKKKTTQPHLMLINDAEGEKKQEEDLKKIKLQMTSFKASWLALVSPGNIGNGLCNRGAERVASDLQHAACDEQEEQEGATYGHDQVHPQALPVEGRVNTKGMRTAAL